MHVGERLFARSWSRIARGNDIDAVASQETAWALTAARLADIDLAALQDVGMEREAALQVLERSLEAISGGLDDDLRERLLRSLHSLRDESREESRGTEPDWPDLPEFARLLIQQPRAGATRPGVGRVVLEPAEMHSDHCGIAAVNAVVCAPLFGVSAGDAFLTGLTHHFHNAWWPDAGDALIGEHLAPALQKLRERAPGLLSE